MKYETVHLAMPFYALVLTCQGFLLLEVVKRAVGYRRRRVFRRLGFRGY